MDSIVALNTFSEGGHGVLEYAAELAQLLGCRLNVHGYYFVPIIPGEIPVPVVSVEESRTIANGQLESTAARLRNTYPRLPLETALIYGDVQDAITPDSSGPGPLLTIIPNSESTSELAFDSDLLLRELSDPVLCVPAGCTARIPNRICVAVAADGQQPELTGPLFTRIRAEQALEISYFSIRASDADAPDAEADPRLRIVSASNVETGILEELKRSNADWLVISPRAHGFFSGLFRHNHTTQLLRDISIPVLSVG